MGNFIKNSITESTVLPTSPELNKEEKTYTNIKRIIPLDLEGIDYINDVEKMSLEMKKLFKNDFYNRKKQYVVSTQALFQPNSNIVI